MRLKCLVATSFDGIKDQLNRLYNKFDCTYEPDLLLPNPDYKEFDILVVNPNNLRWRLDSSTLNDLNQLKFILTISTGVAHIDLEFLKQKNIKLISLKNNTLEMKNITATAELAFLLFIAEARNFNFSTSLKSIQKWDWREFVGKQLNERTVGIIGKGRLGSLFKHYCEAFDCKTLWYDPNVLGGEPTINKIFETCEVISIHANYTPGDDFLVDEQMLNLAAPQVHIINTARGELVDEKALVKFLKQNEKAHYSADVISDEQNKQKSSLYKYFLDGGNVTLTPHIGGMTTGSRQLAYDLGITKFLNYMEKENEK